MIIAQYLHSSEGIGSGRNWHSNKISQDRWHHQAHTALADRHNTNQRKVNVKNVKLGSQKRTFIWS